MVFFWYKILNFIFINKQHVMKIKAEYIGAIIYNQKLDLNIEVKESNIELLKSLGINYIFEVEEQQVKKK